MTTIFDSLQEQDQINKPVEVQLSLALVRLLSEQLYQSPMKAIEELVVNAYDASAKQCSIFVPSPSNLDDDHIVIFDDGQGMSYGGLTDLWQIGRSNKRNEEIEKRSGRRQIGKFGIGKLATYTIAKQLTYLTKTDEGILGLTIDFTQFDQPDPIIDSSSIDEAFGSDIPLSFSDRLGEDDQVSKVRRIELPVYEVSDWGEFEEQNGLSAIYRDLNLNIDLAALPSWTFAILENLKPQRTKLTQGRLEWVLRTAMPLSSDFQIFLNGEKVTSSKGDYKKVVEFNIADLPQKRIDDLSSNTGQVWSKNDGRLVLQRNVG